ncbi:MAG: YtxH domain-containing protein [Patescibacteria group bacterium]
MKKLKAGILAVGIGVGGYIAGILTAPKSGKETRADIKTNAGKAKVATEQELKNLQQELSKLIDKAESKADVLKVKSGAEKEKLIANSKKAKAKADEVIKSIKSKEVKDPDLKKAVADLKKAKDNLAKFIKS